MCTTESVFSSCATLKLRASMCESGDITIECMLHLMTMGVSPVDMTTSDMLPRLLGMLASHRGSKLLSLYPSNGDLPHSCLAQNPPPNIVYKPLDRTYPEHVPRHGPRSRPTPSISNRLNILAGGRIRWRPSWMIYQLCDFVSFGVELSM